MCVCGSESIVSVPVFTSHGQVLRIGFTGLKLLTGHCAEYARVGLVNQSGWGLAAVGPVGRRGALWMSTACHGSVGL